MLYDSPEHGDAHADTWAEDRLGRRADATFQFLLNRMKERAAQDIRYVLNIGAQWGEAFFPGSVKRLPRCRG